MEETNRSTVSFKTPMGLPPQMVVSFGVESAAEKEFNDFYNSEFLAKLFPLSPQLRSIKRFEKYNPEQLEEPGKGDYVTFYELDGLDILDKTDSIFGNEKFKESLLKFRQYKDTVLKNFSRYNYRPMHLLEREPGGIGLSKAKHTRLYVVNTILRAAGANKFCQWYLDHYLPAVFAGAPEIAALHTYIVHPEAEEGPCLMSVFETDSDDLLRQALDDLGRGDFGENNSTWQAFCDDSTVVGLSFFALRSIFHLP